MDKLNKSITLPRGVALAVGMVLGSGMLGLPGIVVSAAGPQCAIIGWLAVIIAMIPMMVIFSYLGSTYTTAAGLTAYARTAFGAWAQDSATFVLWGTYSIGIPALACIGGAYVCRLFDIDSRLWGLAIAFAILLVSTVINLLGTAAISVVNMVSLWMIALLICALIAAHPDYFALGFRGLADSAQGACANPRGLIAAMGLIVYAFLGWENMSFSAEEFRNPKRTIPMTYWLSFAVVSLLYLSLAFVVNGAQSQGTDVTGAAGLVGLLPSGARPLVTALIIVAIIANANAWVLGASRLTFSAGRSGLLPDWFSKVTSRGMPMTALAGMMAVYTIVIIVAGVADISTDTLIGIVSQNFLVLYVVSIVAYVKTVRANHPKRAAMVCAWIVALLSLIICVTLLTGFTWWIVYPLILGMIGAAIYRYRNSTTQEADHE
ncbi:APC family permease [Bifidobacterium apri]|uniref:APC family permease n=1 Tax=Bifidobacterium apri TaxID=1769423 RepID=UPI003993E7D3